MIPSFNEDWFEQQRIKPRILVLEVRNPKHLERPPVAFLVIERRETIRQDERDNSVFEATVRLSYEVISDRRLPNDMERGDFSGCYSKLYGLTSLTSSSLVHGAVFLDPARLRGHRIGTYLMNEIVTWAKRWPEAEVKPIELRADQAQDDNKDRRNWFYEQFGLVFDYADAEHRGGTSRPMLVRDLKQVEKWQENVTEHRMFDYLADAHVAKESALFDLRMTKQANQELIAEQRSAERHPIRWMLRQFC